MKVMISFTAERYNYDNYYVQRIYLHIMYLSNIFSIFKSSYHNCRQYMNRSEEQICTWTAWTTWTAGQSQTTALETAELQLKWCDDYTRRYASIYVIF